MKKWTQEDIREMIRINSRYSEYMCCYYCSVIIATHIKYFRQSILRKCFNKMYNMSYDITYETEQLIIDQLIDENSQKELLIQKLQQGQQSQDTNEYFLVAEQ